MKYLIHDILEYEIIELRLKRNGDNHMHSNNFKYFLHR